MTDSVRRRKSLLDWDWFNQEYEKFAKLGKVSPGYGKVCSIVIGSVRRGKSLLHCDWLSQEGEKFAGL